MLEALGYAAVYSVVGTVLLGIGFYVLDLLTPGHLGRHIIDARSVNAAIVASAGLLGLGLVIFTAIWTNADSGFGSALGWTVAFGAFGIALQAAVFLVLDLVTPGRLRDIVCEVPFHPASLLTASAMIAVSGIVVASIA